MTCFRQTIGTSIFALSLVTLPAAADQESWEAESIADAVRAAPPTITAAATVYGWSPEGALTVARYGSGPYTCIASGSFSIRLGKPALPYPDPMCLYQNAWAFLKAIWSGNGAGEPLPTAPGLVWMLAGMNVSKDAVDVGAGKITMTDTGEGDGDVLQMTPHVMIMPLPFDEAAAALTTSYNLEDPLAAWIMAAGKAHEHLMVHFSVEDTAALMQAGN